MNILMKRITTREAFGRKLAQMGTIQTQVAECRIALDTCRVLVQHAAEMVDKHGGVAARKQVAMIKVYVPRAVCNVLDTAIQMHGGMGVSGDTILAGLYAAMRTLRIADGPDDVHLRSIARLEMREWQRASKL